MTTARPHTPVRLARRGFTFVEILFAVMILGIGFIMLAGVFPVAISQQQTNADETIAAGLARGAAVYLSKAPGTAAAMADTSGTLHQISEDANLWKQVKQNVIPPEDPRYAWVALWRRSLDQFGQPAAVAQVIVIAVRSRNAGTYTTADLDNGNLTAKAVSVNVIANTSVAVSGAGQNAATDGAFVVTAAEGRSRVYRLGPETSPGSHTYSLNPGDVQTAFSGSGFVVGQGFVPGSTTYGGGVQDVTVYSTYIPLH